MVADPGVRTVISVESSSRHRDHRRCDMAKSDKFSKSEPTKSDKTDPAVAESKKSD